MTPMHCHENADTLTTCKNNCQAVARELDGFTTYILKVASISCFSSSRVILLKILHIVIQEITLLLQGDEPMCFHALLPESQTPMPVILQIDCRAKGRTKFGSLNFKKPNDKLDTWNAKRSGYARLGISNCGVRQMGEFAEG